MFIDVQTFSYFVSSSFYGFHFFRFLIFREKRKKLSHFSRKTKKKRKNFPPIYLWNRACDFNLQYAKLSISSSPIEIWPQNYKNIFITSSKWPRKPPISSWNVEKSSKFGKNGEKSIFRFSCPIFRRKTKN